jgi:site-specific recombinase XerD
MRSMVLSKAVEGFLITRTAEGYSQDTLRIYKWALSNLVEYLGDPEIKAVTATNLQAFYAYLQNEYVPQRRNGDLSPQKPRSIENAWTE